MRRAALLAAAGWSFWACDRRTETECPDAALHPTLLLELRAQTDEPFVLPTDAVRVPERPGVFFITEQTGRVWELDRGRGERRVVLDLSGEVARFEENWELGLYAVTVHPDFPTDDRVYVSFTAGSGGGIRSRIVEYRLGNDGVWDPATRRVIFERGQPNPVHNGGDIRFLLDGRLGYALGDGDESGQSQDEDDTLGKFMAIDVDTGAIQILAVGFRNPWRWAVSPFDGQVFVGDVGHFDREEINRLVSPGNFGWPRYQGTEPDRGEPFCDECGPLQPPVVEYCRSEGGAVVAGLFYRGTEIPALRGQFIYGDFRDGTLFVLAPDAQGPTGPTIIGETSANVTAFFEDHDNEVLAISRSSGQILALAGVDFSDDPPDLLSETDFVDPATPTEPPPDAVSYSVNHPFFSDGAGKARWLIPAPGNPTIETLDDGRLNPPIGSALVKYFEIDGQPVETRVYRHESDDQWRGYSYRWQDDGTDAELLRSGEARQVGETPWLYPSRADCDSCHTSAAGPLLGFHLAQLTPPSLTALEESGALDETRPEIEPLIVADESSDLDLDLRARTYLQVNCASCHQPGGGGGGALDLRLRTPEAETQLCERPQVDAFEIDNPRIVAPGDLDRSVLWQRIRSTDRGAMNPFRQTRDLEGEELLRTWINERACRP